MLEFKVVNYLLVEMFALEPKFQILPFSHRQAASGEKFKIA